jgi:hypothetical protein
MKLRKLIDWITGKNTLNKKCELNLRTELNSQKFIDWIKKQNTMNKFATRIKNGTTVYFRDDLAASYDLMIQGLLNDKKCIVIEFEKSFVGKDFIEIAIDIWTKEAGWELWYIGGNLQWMIKANENGRIKYGNNDLIKSNVIDFEFKLNQIR